MKRAAALKFRVFSDGLIVDNNMTMFFNYQLMSFFSIGMTLSFMLMFLFKDEILYRDYISMHLLWVALVMFSMLRLF